MLLYKIEFFDDKIVYIIADSIDAAIQKTNSYDYRIKQIKVLAEETEEGYFVE